jgi:hypothetical protein
VLYDVQATRGGTVVITLKVYVDRVAGPKVAKELVGYAVKWELPCNLFHIENTEYQISDVEFISAREEPKDGK